MASISLKFTCPLCGGNSLDLPEGYTDNSIASCASCGAEIGRWGELKALAASQQPAGEKTAFKGLSSTQGKFRT